MNSELKKSIELYVELSSRLFTQLASDLNVALPIKALDWALLSIERSGTSKSGIRYRKHGAGVEMWYEGKTVDFDLGADGELNGVDPWRLFYFTQDNGVPLPYHSVEEVREEFKLLTESGELSYSGSILYYAAWAK